jgi:hypothetical protein
MDGHFAYSIIPRLRTPAVDPGGQIEIEVYLVGYGTPKQNKLYVGYSSPYVISEENSGEFVFSIKVSKDKVTGEVIQPVSGKDYLDNYKCDKIGTTIVLNEGHFLPVPESSSQGGFPRVMSELSHDGYPPILIRLNTAKKAHAGDYDIYLSLTYGDQQQVLQDQKRVTFHVNSWWDRWKVPFTIFGIILVVPTFIMGIIGLVRLISQLTGG